MIDPKKKNSFNSNLILFEFFFLFPSNSARTRFTFLSDSVRMHVFFFVLLQTVFIKRDDIVWLDAIEIKLLTNSRQTCNNNRTKKKNDREHFMFDFNTIFFIQFIVNPNWRRNFCQTTCALHMERKKVFFFFLFDTIVY